MAIESVKAADCRVRHRHARGEASIERILGAGRLLAAPRYQKLFLTARLGVACTSAPSDTVGVRRCGVTEVEGKDLERREKP